VGPWVHCRLIQRVWTCQQAGLGPGEMGQCLQHPACSSKRAPAASWQQPAWPAQNQHGQGPHWVVLQLAGLAAVSTQQRQTVVLGMVAHGTVGRECSSSQQQQHWEQVQGLKWCV
jgi:hypothetical protein